MNDESEKPQGYAYGRIDVDMDDLIKAALKRRKFVHFLNRANMLMLVGVVVMVASFFDDSPTLTGILLVIGILMSINSAHLFWQMRR